MAALAYLIYPICRDNTAIVSRWVNAIGLVYKHRDSYPL